jgi:hypothetical protein
MYLCRFTPQVYSFHKRIAPRLSYFEIMPIMDVEKCGNHYRNCTQCDFNWRTADALECTIGSIYARLQSIIAARVGAVDEAHIVEFPIGAFIAKGEELNNHVERLVEQVNAAGPVAKPMDVIVVECSVCYEEYDEGERIPIARTCGHVVCLKCVKNMHTANVLLRCHTCRAMSGFVRLFC